MSDWLTVVAGPDLAVDERPDRSDERQLAVRVRAQCATSAEILVRRHARLILSIARSVTSDWRPALDPDLFQEGALGFLEGVRRYDGRDGVLLTSYAGWWVRAYVCRWNKVRRRRSKVEVEAEGVLDGVIDEAAATEGAIAARTPRPDHAFEQAQREEVVRMRIERLMALPALSDQQRFVLRRRFLTDDPTTQVQLALELGVSRQRIEQIESAALKLLVAAAGMVNWEQAKVALRANLPKLKRGQSGGRRRAS